MECLPSADKAPAHDPACCGLTPCDVCFEHDFMRQVRLLYPDFQGKLCVHGVFDNLIQALVRPLYDLYVCDCGACDLERELSPFTACCTLDRWFAEYGLPDDCFRSVCFLEPDIEIMAKRAQLHARASMEIGGAFNQALMRTIAEPLGIKFDIIAPNINPDGSSTSPDNKLWGISGLQLPPDEPGPNDCASPVTQGRSFDCRELSHIAGIRITGAPKTIYATACDVIAQPMAYNPWVESFKCLIENVRPCHLEICWFDAFAGTTPTPIPPFVNPCPNASGHFVDPSISGNGTPEDPYELDFTKLHPDQVTALIEAVCCENE